ncbi:MAG: DUF503 domain-containing protein [Desulfobacterales bacterium]|nr:DUF503 domain-containing protein [Desulfobacterales bacterium]MCP4159174.1 DUF503 domain-containing protein [Deltaproteobacteria bacterium]
MVVGYGVLKFRIYECRSLKEKRKIIKPIIEKIRNKFNASVAETGGYDSYKVSEVGISVTGNDRRVVNSVLDKIIQSVEYMEMTDLIDTDFEIINF